MAKFVHINQALLLPATMEDEDDPPPPPDWEEEEEDEDDIELIGEEDEDEELDAPPLLELENSPSGSTISSAASGAVSDPVSAPSFRWRRRRPDHSSATG